MMSSRWEGYLVQDLLGYQEHYSFTLSEMGSHCR